MGPELPKNMVIVTATIRRGLDEYTTSINAQTHKLEEVDFLIERAWKATRQEATDAAPAVRSAE
jgi:hypothetical protein